MNYLKLYKLNPLFFEKHLNKEFFENLTSKQEKSKIINIRNKKDPIKIPMVEIFGF